MTARDIMSTAVVSITEQQTLQEAIELMARYNISGLPVTDEHHVLVGIISNTDIIRYSQQVSVVPLMDLSGWVSPHTNIADIASLRKGIDLLANTAVSRLMKKKVYTASENTEIIDLARLMSQRKINRIPILDPDRKLIGIVTRTDLVRSLAKPEQ